MSALTPEEAQHFLKSAINVCQLIEDSERPDSAAILRAHMDCGDALVLLGALITVLAEQFPQLVDGPISDMASLYFRSIN